MSDLLNCAVIQPSLINLMPSGILPVAIKLSPKINLPKPLKGKMNASQALSEKRWKDRFIGKRRKHKDTDDNLFDGLLSALGLVRAFYAEDKKKVFLTLTEKGKEFYRLDNTITARVYDGVPKFRGSFDPKERKFLVTEILPERKLEMELIKTAIK